MLEPRRSGALVDPASGFGGGSRAVRRRSSGRPRPSARDARHARRHALRGSRLRQEALGDQGLRDPRADEGPFGERVGERDELPPGMLGSVPRDGPSGSLPVQHWCRAGSEATRLPSTATRPPNAELTSRLSGPFAPSPARTGEPDIYWFALGKFVFTVDESFSTDGALEDLARRVNHRPPSNETSGFGTPASS